MAEETTASVESVASKPSEVSGIPRDASGAGSGGDSAAGAAGAAGGEPSAAAEAQLDVSRFSGLRVILGSSSKWRRSVMDTLGLPGGYTCESPDIDEKAVRHPDPEQIPVEVAKAKAEALLARTDRAKPGLLITGDQVVLYDGKVREKPESTAEAHAFMASYRAAPAVTVAAVVVTDIESGRMFSGVDKAEVHFDAALPDAAIEGAIAGGEGDCMWCCGALCIEDPHVAPHITRFVGTEDSIMGLPKALLVKLMNDAAASRAD